MIIYYQNILLFAITIYISFQIAKQLRKKIFKNKPNIKGMMNTEKNQLKLVLKAIKNPTKIDQKQNLIQLMEQIDANYMNLVRFMIYYSIIPLIIIAILEIVLQKITLIEIGGHEIKWFTILLILLPIALFKWIRNIKKGNIQLNPFSTHSQ